MHQPRRLPGAIDCHEALIASQLLKFGGFENKFIFGINS
jgi:hypothetical protein